MQPGVADFEILTAVGQECRPRVEARPGLPTRFRSLGLCRLAGIECRHERIQLGDPAALAVEALSGFACGVLDGLEFGLRVAAFALCTGQCGRRCRKPGVMGVELAAELSFARPGSVQLGAGGLLGSDATLELSGGDVEALLGFLQCRRGGPTTGDADAPPRRSEAVALIGDDDGGGMSDRHIDRVCPVRHAHGRPDDGVEQLGDTGLQAAHMRAHRHALVRRRRSDAVRSTERDHRTVHVRRSQRIEGTPAGMRRGDHDRLQRLTQRGFDGCFPPGIDVDEVEQRAENVVDACEVFCAGACSRALQRQVQRLGAGSPPRDIVGGDLACGHRGLMDSLGRHATSFGNLQVGDQPSFDDLRVLAFQSQPLGIGIETNDALAQHVESSPQALQFAFGAVDAAS